MFGQGGAEALAVGAGWWEEAGLTEEEAWGLPWAEVSRWGAIIRDALALDLNDAARDRDDLARALEVFDDELLPAVEELEQNAGGSAEGSPRLQHVLAAVRRGRRPTLPLPARASSSVSPASSHQATPAASSESEAIVSASRTGASSAARRATTRLVVRRAPIRSAASGRPLSGIARLKR